MLIWAGNWDLSCHTQSSLPYTINISSSIPSARIRPLHFLGPIVLFLPLFRPSCIADSSRAHPHESMSLFVDACPMPVQGHGQSYHHASSFVHISLQKRHLAFWLDLPDTINGDSLRLKLMQWQYTGDSWRLHHPLLCSSEAINSSKQKLTYLYNSVQNNAQKINSMYSLKYFLYSVCKYKISKKKLWSVFQYIYK